MNAWRSDAAKASHFDLDRGREHVAAWAAGLDTSRSRKEEQGGQAF